MSRQLLLWRVRFPETKQAGRTDPAGIEIPGFDMATTSITSVHALKRHCCLQIKAGSGLYTAINNFSFQKKWKMKQNFVLLGVFQENDFQENTFPTN